MQPIQFKWHDMNVTREIKTLTLLIPSSNLKNEFPLEEPNRKLGGQLSPNICHLQ